MIANARSGALQDWEFSAVLALHEVTEAALGALAQPGALVPFDIVRASIALEQIGNALRLSLAVPAALARWLDELTGAQLTAVVAPVRAELDGLPAVAAARRAEHLLEEIACARDRAESVKLGVTRACVARGMAPIGVAGFDEFLAAIDVVDRDLAAVDRTALARALGDRRWLSLATDWTTGRPATDGREGIAMPVPACPDNLPTSLAPPSAAVLAYAQRGQLSRWVEGAAARSVAFGDGLAAAIDDLIDASEPIALIARRWRMARSNVGELAPIEQLVRLAVRPRATVHAAGETAADAAAPVEVLLGQLCPIAAEGRLLAYPDAVELRLVAASGSLAAVQLGGECAPGADANGTWVVRVTNAAARGPLALRVEAVGGETFEVVLQIDPAA